MNANNNKKSKCWVIHIVLQTVLPKQVRKSNKKLKPKVTCR